MPFHPIFGYLMADPTATLADAGYSVRFRVFRAATQAFLFGRGELDVITTVPSLMPRLKERYGIDTTFFFPMARWTPGPELLVARDSPAQSIADLEGKRVAIPPLNSRFGAEEAAVLASTGGTIRSYFALRETDTAAEEVVRGRADAAFLEAPATASLLEKGYRPVFSVQEAFDESFGDPAVMNGGFMASSDFVDRNPDFVATLVRHTQEVWAKLQGDPATVISEASRVSGVKPSELELVARVLNLARATDKQMQVSERDIRTWQKIFSLLRTSGFIGEESGGPGALSRTVREVLELIEMEPERPWRVADLARHASVATRTLQEAFRRELGISPLEQLRRTRMERVRRDLVAGDPRWTSVTEVAARWGFFHGGRFAQTYRATYREPPSHTLAR
ncbi:helix-turn-helix domain-containing protein [Halostreptopolyspora alba]|uniref:Helix-turn-helix domain-containing protein n=1 Tax=Halostreptopolyspora alba TaxID=2487137 RepID=A0A3N0E301_9ACTN|nr:helix-turn-helix domain-containing protein [Nocardiopsaceae bacterium YIM 96095]